jgi:hypothetical protein
VKRIKRKQFLSIGDFEMASREVNPPYAPGGCNWTTGEGGRRLLHMRDHNSHARFLATGIESGHYNISLAIAFSLSARLSAIGRLQLSANPLGKLKIYIGWPKNRNTFLNSKFADDEDLPDKLFSQKAVRGYSMPDEDGIFKVEFEGVTFSLDANTGASQIGFLLQWERSPKLTNSDDAIAKICLLQATYVLCPEASRLTGGRLDDLYEWQKNDDSDDGSSNVLNNLIAAAIIRRALEEQEEEERQEQLRREQQEEAEQEEAMRQLMAGMVLKAFLQNGGRR